MSFVLKADLCTSTEEFNNFTKEFQFFDNINSSKKIINLSEKVLNYIENKIMPKENFIENCFNYICEILEKCSEEVLEKFANSFEFIKIISICILNRFNTISDVPNSTYASHTLYNHCLLCLLSLIEATKCLRTFIRTASKGALITSMVGHICSILVQDEAFYTQEMVSFAFSIALTYQLSLNKI
jgi:hypothetical protein